MRIVHFPFIPYIYSDNGNLGGITECKYEQGMLNIKCPLYPYNGTRSWSCKTKQNITKTEIEPLLKEEKDTNLFRPWDKCCMERLYLH